MEIGNTSIWQIIALTVLRVFIGWHFLYEGLIKLFDPSWSSVSFLAASKGPFNGIFQGMATSPTLLELVDVLNQWGLIIVGLSLFMGFFSRWACLGGILLLLLYYLSHPPFIGLESTSNEGSYLIINKNLIEAAALLVLFLFPTERVYGIERLFSLKVKKEKPVHA